LVIAKAQFISISCFRRKDFICDKILIALFLNPFRNFLVTLSEVEVFCALKTKQDKKLAPLRFPTK